MIVYFRNVFILPEGGNFPARAGGSVESLSILRKGGKIRA